MTAAPRTRTEAAAALVASIVGGFAILVCVAGASAVVGLPVVPGYKLMLAAAFGSLPAIHEWLVLAGTLILTGLATSVALRIGLNNFGAEGQYLAGVLVVIAVGTKTGGWPAWAVFPLDLIAGALAGALLMWVATVLKLRRGVEETIVTLLLNVVMLLLVRILLAGPFAGRSGVALLAQYGIPTGLLVALVAAAAVAAVTRYTVWGFALRALAGNAAAARFAGIGVGWMTIRVALLSGALAGVAGVCQIASTGGDPRPGLGYAGIAVAMLAWLSPVGVVAAALFVAALMIGAEPLARAGVPAALPDLLVALTLLVSLVGRVLVLRRAHGIAEAAS